MNTPNDAVILARVSSKSQEDEGYSLDSQVKLLENYSESKKLRVRKIFKITETASKTAQRKVFKQAMTYIAENQIKHLVIEKVDRHVRNLHDAVETHDWLAADEARFAHFVKDSLVLHKNSKSQEWFNWGIRVVMAKNYIDNLREEAMKGWAEKLAQGWLPAVPPPGYMTVTENGKRIHVPNPDTYRIMQRMFKLYMEPHASIKLIASEMHRLGIRTRSGNRYADSHVHKVLMNPFYIGINQFDGAEYPGAQKPIISKDLFDAVQAKMHNKRPVKYRRHNPVLKGMLWCGYCDKLITWQLQKGVLYGSCQRNTAECKAQKMIREEDAHGAIVDMLGNLVSPSQEIITWLTTLLKENFNTELNNRKDAVDAIEHRIKRLQQMDEMLYDDKLAGEVNAERYKSKHEAFLAEIETLNSQKGGIDPAYERKYMQGISIIKLTQVAKEQYLDEKLDNDSKRDILTKLFEKMVVKDGSVSVIYTKLTQAIAQKSSETRRIYGQLKTA